MSRATAICTHFDVSRRLAMLAAVTLTAAALIGAKVSARPIVEPVVEPAAALTVVELFTSQGCSSCPPANANLLVLSRRSDLLALSFGVTYWDQLGWTDTFASEAFTRRQRDYQRGLGNDNVWTPQVVVDGRADVVGQNRTEIERLIAAHRDGGGPTVVFRGDAVGLAGGPRPTAPADIWLVRYESAPLEVPVIRGENGGRTLPHANVVRELVRLGAWTGDTVGHRLAPATRTGLRTAILVQAPNGGPILTAARAG